MINEYEPTAMVDTGANPSFISKSFCDLNAIQIDPDTTDTQVYRAGRLEPRHGTTKVTIRNGTITLPNLQFTVLPNIDFDLIIGCNYHQHLGYKLIGVPTKKPGQPVIELNDSIAEEEIKPDPVTYPPLIAALEANAKINILEPCTQPLAKWNLSFTEEPTYWS
jgi:hypothetical protein